MTASRDLGQRLPELMAELAPGSVPDYFDDLLRATERMPQRRAWTSLERWLPVEHILQPLQRGLPPLRPILLLAVIGALLVAIAAVVVAGAKPALPPPFGLARNGVILTSNAAGDVVSVDPA